MNNPFLQERLVELKQQEIEREVEQARLLKEAGLSGVGLFARVGKFVRHLLAARRERRKVYRTLEQKPNR